MSVRIGDHRGEYQPFGLCLAEELGWLSGIRIATADVQLGGDRDE
jgi:hypothetical protein